MVYLLKMVDLSMAMSNNQMVGVSEVGLPEHMVSSSFDDQSLDGMGSP